jgi:AraC-like DNA-binding protein
MTINPRMAMEIASARAVTLGDTVVAHHCSTAPSRDGETHFDMPMVMVVVNGCTTIRWDDRCLSIPAGHAMFAAPRSYRIRQDTPSCDSLTIGFASEFVAAFCDRQADALGAEHEETAGDAAFLLRITPFLKSAIESLPVFLGAAERPSDQLLTVKLDELALALIDADARVWPQLSASSRHDRRLLDYVATRSASDHSLTTLARGAGQSLSTFKRHFRAATGVPPAAWVRQKRLARAKLLLETSDRSVTDIALDVGFSSVSHFVHTFRRRYQITPHRIRTTRRERRVYDE